MYLDEPKEDDGSGIESHDIVGAFIDNGHRAIAFRWSDGFSGLCGTSCEVTLSGLEDDAPYIFIRQKRGYPHLYRWGRNRLSVLKMTIQWFANCI